MHLVVHALLHTEVDASCSAVLSASHMIQLVRSNQARCLQSRLMSAQAYQVPRTRLSVAALAPTPALLNANQTP